MSSKIALGLLILIVLSNVSIQKNLYKVLEVERKATQAEIKRKYRELSKKYHPDKNRGDKDSADKYREINEAYEILSDPKKRRKYDQGGMDAVNNQAQEGGFDPFADMFGGLIHIM